MKKLLLTLTLALFGLNAMMAQSSLVATLSHEGNVSLFYGYNAFVDAMAAADHGDVITLSSGLFAPTTITKAITIRGAAMADDPEKGILKTEINGTVYIEIPDETNGKTLTMEYMYINSEIRNSSKLQSPRFHHLAWDWGYAFYPNSDTGACIKDALFINVSGSITFNYGGEYDSLSIINSVINNISYNSNKRECNVINSIVYNPYYTVGFYGIYSAKFVSFKNCIFPGFQYVLDGSNICDHCLAIVDNNNADILANMVGTNWTVNSSSEIFTGEDNYVLTPTAAQTYLGTDGTQIGIWGGVMPWQTTAETPTITKCNVANRSTADGKLSVEIEVSGVQ